MQITTVGLDLAMNVIQVHAVNQYGKAILKKSLKRNQVLPFFANLTLLCTVLGAYRQIPT